MDCRHESATVDFCSEPECFNSMITFDTANMKPHTQNHAMFKVNRIIFDRDIRVIESVAGYALTLARETTSKLKKGKEPMPGCVQCKTTISLSCWVCADCTGEPELQYCVSNRFCDIVNP